MSAYIEGFRNVPVLLWIVMVFALLTEFTPAPKAFKGADPQATMLFLIVLQLQTEVHTFQRQY